MQLPFEAGDRGGSVVLAGCFGESKYDVLSSELRMLRRPVAEQLKLYLEVWGQRYNGSGIGRGSEWCPALSVTALRHAQNGNEIMNRTTASNPIAGLLGGVIIGAITAVAIATVIQSMAAFAAIVPPLAGGLAALFLVMAAGIGYSTGRFGGFIVPGAFFVFGGFGILMANQVDDPSVTVVALVGMFPWIFVGASFLAVVFNLASGGGDQPA